MHRSWNGGQSDLINLFEVNIQKSNWTSGKVYPARLFNRKRGKKPVKIASFFPSNVGIGVWLRDFPPSYIKSSSLKIDAPKNSGPLLKVSKALKLTWVSMFQCYNFACLREKQSKIIQEHLSETKHIQKFFKWQTKFFKPVEVGSFTPIIYKVLAPSKRWLALGFL